MASLKRLFNYFILVATSVLLAACGSGSSDTAASTGSNIGTDGAKLVGTWGITTSCSTLTGVYKNDGTYSFTSSDGGSESGTWALNGTTYTHTVTAGTKSVCTWPIRGSFTQPVTVDTSVTPNTATDTNVKFTGLFGGTNNATLLKTDSTETTPALPGTYMQYNSSCAAGQESGGITFNADLSWTWIGNGVSYAGTYAVSGTTITFTTVSGTASSCVSLGSSWTITNYALSSSTGTITKQ